MPRLIALYSSQPGSGKSTLAGYLVRNHRFTLVPFAGPLKAWLVQFLVEFGYSSWEAHRLMHQDKAAPLDRIPSQPTPRRLMQTLGTDWGRRMIDPEIWICLWLQQVTRLLEQGRSVVCDDLRFPGELAHVQRLGGEAYEIIRPGLPLSDCASHESEGQLSGQLPALRNDQGLDFLANTAHSLATC